MIYSFGFGCLRDAAVMYRQTDMLGSPGALTQAALSEGRGYILYYIRVFLSILFHFLFSVSAWLTHWKSGGGEKQLDGTSNVTYNSSSYMRAKSEMLPVHPVTDRAHFNTVTI